MEKLIIKQIPLKFDLNGISEIPMGEIKQNLVQEYSRDFIVEERTFDYKIIGNSIILSVVANLKEKL